MLLCENDNGRRQLVVFKVSCCRGGSERLLWGGRGYFSLFF
jgi:hypothetical protein